MLKEKSADWNAFRIELKLDGNYGDTLAHDPRLNDDGRLDKVLTKWMEAQPSPVTWAKILEILESLQLRSIAKKVNDYLQSPDVINKYIKKEDFRGEYITVV